MKILIVGAGIVGSNLAEELSHEGHDISIVDQNQAKIEHLSQRLDILGVPGEAGRISILKTAGIEEADMLIAVTNIDEVNIILCMLAQKFGIKTRIARLRNEEYVNSNFLNLENTFISRVINPEKIVVNSIVQTIETPGATYVASFANGAILLRGFDVPPDAPIIGRTLSELREIEDMDAFLIGGIARHDQFIIPKGNDQIQAGDHIFVLIAKDTLPFFLPLINKRIWSVQRVIIYGCNRIGINLAQSLESHVKEVVLLVENEAQAQTPTGQLNKTVVLKGEGTDLDCLRDANIKETDFYIALTDDDEDNLISSLLAKKHGARRTVVLAHDPDYASLFDSIGMDVVINPRLITVGAILEYIRRGKVRSVAKLKESEAEVIEMVAVTNSRIVGKPLKNIKFPKGALIGAVIKGETPVIPRGDTIIKPGERVVIFALPESIKKMEDLFLDRS